MSKKRPARKSHPRHTQPRSSPPENPVSAVRPCPYCGGKFSAAGAVTVTKLLTFAHFTCHTCGRVFTVRSTR